MAPRGGGVQLTVCSLVLSVLDLPALLVGSGPGLGIIGTVADRTRCLGPWVKLLDKALPRHLPGFCMSWRSQVRAADSCCSSQFRRGHVSRVRFTFAK